MEARLIPTLTLLAVCIALCLADGGYNRGRHDHYGFTHRASYRPKGYENEYRPYGNVMSLDNGHFGYNPDDGTYGQPHYHNAKRGYGGYGNLLNNAYGFGYQYGVLGRAEAHGYNKWNAKDLLEKLNTRQIHYRNAY